MVQFSKDGEQYLRFGIKPGTLGDFYDFIIDRFAEEADIICIQIPGPDGRLPALSPNSLYRTVGAGWCDINPNERTLRFSGKSREYGLKINQNCLDKLMKELPEWEFR